MTNKEFLKRIQEQYEEYEKEIINTKSPTEIIDMAFKIAKMQEIYSFIQSELYIEIDKLFPYVDNLLKELYDFEFNYDEPQWYSWEKLDNMCSDYILWKEGKEI